MQNLKNRTQKKEDPAPLDQEEKNSYDIINEKYLSNVKLIFEKKCKTAALFVKSSMISLWNWQFLTF